MKKPYSRALQTLALASQGLRCKAIAHKMGISDRTVHSHLANARLMMQAESTAHAIALAIRNGWL